jgi:hypothetical protein
VGNYLECVFVLICAQHGVRGSQASRRDLIRSRILQKLPKKHVQKLRCACPERPCKYGPFDAAEV